MQTVRVYDPDRSPPNWTGIIQPGQFVAFSARLESEAPCDAEGTPFASPDEVTCLIFDSLPAAAAFSRESVERVPSLRFDIFDSAGLTQPPLLTIVHASRTGALDGNRRATRQSNWGAVALIIAGPTLIWLDWAKYDGLLVLPTIAGINCLVFAARLLQLNGAYASAEKSRRERLARHGDHGGL